MKKLKIYAHAFLIILYFILTIINFKAMNMFKYEYIAKAIIIAEQSILTILVILCIILMNKKEW